MRYLRLSVQAPRGSIELSRGAWVVPAWVVALLGASLVFFGIGWFVLQRRDERRRSLSAAHPRGGAASAPSAAPLPAPSPAAAPAPLGGAPSLQPPSLRPPSDARDAPVAGKPGTR